MKIYFAGCDGKVYADLLKSADGKHALYSYYHLKKTKFNTRFDFPNVFIDSGAFSAKTLGAAIDIVEYSEYVKANKFTLYSVLDEIGNFEQTKINQLKMESLGLKPLPCVHYGATKEQLHYWFSRYDYIAIGGVVPHAKFHTRLYKWLDVVFQVAREHWPIKLHLFGSTSKRTLLRYPFYSADSSTWLAASRYGRSLAVSQDARMQFFNKKTHGYQKRTLEEVEHYKKLETHLTKVWTNRGIIWE